jgi:putative polyketide hydroxylase
MRLDPGLGKENLMPIVPKAAVELGYRYHSDAVVAEPGEDGSLWESPHEPTARPGSRAPHLALADGTSALDFVRRGFVLLAGPDGQAWCDAAQAAGAELSIPLESRRITDAPGFAELYGTGESGAVLLRPDGFIAWRTRSASADAAGTLAGALRRILVRA